MSAFHAYDIRGVYNSEFNKDDVYKIGFFLPEILNANKILVGRDVRLSSPEISEYLTRGMTDAGADVHNAGLATTPMIYWSTAKLGYDASVMITASHNAKEYNGLKVSQKDALPVGYSNGLSRIETAILENKPMQPSFKKGIISELDLKQEYLDFLRKYKPIIETLKVAIDCSNGMAGLLIRDLLGDDPIYLNEEPDGRFPNHDPNPLNPKNVKQLRATVLKKGCDLGVIFDGDADRVMFLDEKGNFVPPDLIIGALAHYFLKDSNQNVLIDIRTSKSVDNYLRKFGANVHTWKVGRAFAAPKLKEIDGIYGGEFAGHYYFRDFYYSDSGLMACLLMLGIVAEHHKKGISVSSLIAGIKTFENSGELNFRIKEKDAAMEEVKNFYLGKENPTAFHNFDGFRIEFSSWWFNIRPSNTEPYLRLLVEANTPGLLEEKVREIESLLKRFEKDA